MEAQVGWGGVGCPYSFGSAHPSQQQEEHDLSCMTAGMLCPKEERRAEEELSSAGPHCALCLDLHLPCQPLEGMSPISPNTSMSRYKSLEYSTVIIRISVGE